MALRPYAVLAVSLVLACGKSSVRELPPSQRWDPPTPANGFHPLAEACHTIDAAGKIQDSQRGTLEDIGTDASLLATDRDHVYTVVRGTELHRLERETAPWPRPWREETFFTASRGHIVDLAVSDARIYWLVSERGLDGGGPETLYAADKATFTRTLVKTFELPIEKLFARRSGVAFSSLNGIEQIDDDGGPTTPPSFGEGRVVAVTEDEAIVYKRTGFLVTVPRHPWSMSRTISAAESAISGSSDGTFLYWLERGHQAEQGKLRRAALTGGEPADLFAGIPAPEALTVAKGIVWISTGKGLLRYDPTCHFAPVRIAGKADLYGRAAPFGDGLVVAARRPDPRVALLAMP